MTDDNQCQQPNETFETSNQCEQLLSKAESDDIAVHNSFSDIQHTFQGHLAVCAKTPFKPGPPYSCVQKLNFTSSVKIQK